MTTDPTDDVAWWRNRTRDNLASAATQWRADTARARDAKVKLDAAIVAAAGAGMPETQIATMVGCTRMTVRKALGK